MKKDTSDFDQLKPVVDDEVPTHRSDNAAKDNVYNISKVEINQNVIQNQQNLSLIIQSQDGQQVVQRSSE